MTSVTTSPFGWSLPRTTAAIDLEFENVSQKRFFDCQKSQSNSSGQSGLIGPEVVGSHAKGGPRGHKSPKQRAITDLEAGKPLFKTKKNGAGGPSLAWQNKPLFGHLAADGSTPGHRGGP